jgi:hypothetical protein
MWTRWDGDWEKLETVAEELIDAWESVVACIRYRGRGRVSGVEVNSRA